MTGNFQDDDREEAMRVLFGLYKDENEGRDGVDAHLEIDGRIVPFELKTTSNGSVTTVRDFGPAHIEKWQDKHWLIGFFVRGREYYHYGSPAAMAEWITGKANYIRPDFLLADISAQNLTLENMYRVMGKKQVYTYEDARSIQKKQYSRLQYDELRDHPMGYSPHRMLEIFKDRSKYLMQRGSTLNNPHIPASYFRGWIEIVDNHNEVLRALIREYFEQYQN